MGTVPVAVMALIEIARDELGLEVESFGDGVNISYGAPSETKRLMHAWWGDGKTTIDVGGRRLSEAQAARVIRRDANPEDFRIEY